MRYLKKFESKFDILNGLSDEDLEEKIEFLRLEIEDMVDQISYINSILSRRRDSRYADISKDLPRNVFDLNRSQFDFVFEHSNNLGAFRYDISKKYISQLRGVVDSGFNSSTNQFYFKISTMYFTDDNFENYEPNIDAIKSIEFLSRNLKRMGDGYVLFGVLMSYDDQSYSQTIKYFSNNDIKLYDREILRRSFTSIEDLVKFLVDDDIESKEWGI